MLYIFFGTYKAVRSIKCQNKLPDSFDHKTVTLTKDKTENEIINAENLHKHTSTKYNKMIKLCCPFILKHLLHIINVFIETAYFLMAWKISMIREKINLLCLYIIRCCLSFLCFFPFTLFLPVLLSFSPLF